MNSDEKNGGSGVLTTSYISLRFSLAAVDRIELYTPADVMSFVTADEEGANGAISASSLDTTSVCI